jgi:hypothetical protein
MVPGFGRNGPANYLARPAYSAVSPYRRPYLPPYRARVQFVAPIWTGWIGPGFLGYPDTIGDGELAAPPNYAEPYESQPPDVSRLAPANLYADQLSRRVRLQLWRARMRSHLSSKTVALLSIFIITS